MHKDWLNNEYSEWVMALQESTVFNFGSHPMVKRMLGEIENQGPFQEMMDPLTEVQQPIIGEIMNLGGWFHGNVIRKIFYAQKVLNQKPTAICEIGGGVGQFYAVLRALGYKGDYWIYDLPEVQKFQRKYLDEVTRQTGLNTELKERTPWHKERPQYDFCVSLYCLGELDDETKSWYVENVVKKCPHGLVVWNPHSGASDEITWECKVEPENPLTAPNNKLCTW